MSQEKSNNLGPEYPEDPEHGTIRMDPDGHLYEWAERGARLTDHQGVPVRVKRSTWLKMDSHKVGSQ